MQYNAWYMANISKTFVICVKHICPRCITQLSPHTTHCLIRLCLRCGAHNGPPHTTHCVIHLWEFQSGGWEKVWDLSVSQTCMQQYNTTTPKHMNQQTYNVVVNSFVGTLGIMKISSFRVYTPYNVFVHYFVLFHMICIFNFYFQILPLFVER